MLTKLLNLFSKKAPHTKSLYAHPWITENKEPRLTDRELYQQEAHRESILAKIDAVERSFEEQFSLPHA